MNADSLSDRSHITQTADQLMTVTIVTEADKILGRRQSRQLPTGSELVVRIAVEYVNRYISSISTFATLLGKGPMRQTVVLPPSAFVASRVGMAQQSSMPVFDVASVRLSDPNAPMVQMRFAPGGRFVAQGITVKNLIMLAFSVRLDQVAGTIPSWVERTRFDIEAKTEALRDVSGEELQTHSVRRLQALLADRFQLKAHLALEPCDLLLLVPYCNGAKLDQTAQDGGCDATSAGP